jgi:regulatory protein
LGSPTGRAERLRRALELARRYLDRRERAVAEVRRHLESKDLDSATIDDALVTLTELGVLDDARFARVFTEDKRALEQWGAERISRNLLDRGVDRGLIAAALDGEPFDSELARALDVLRRRFPAPPRDERERQRALGVLMRKGYDSDTALDAIRSYARAY